MINLKQKPTIIFILLVVLYITKLLFLSNTSYLLIFKLLPTTYILYLLSRENLKHRNILFLALSFSITGDILLDLNPEKLFVLGLISFAISHIIFITYFIFKYEISKNRTIFKTLIFVITALVLCNIFSVAPKELLIPVWSYILIIFLLATIVFIKEDTNILIKIGVITFILSDLFLAIDKFIIPITGVLIFNSIFYFPSLYMIITGAVNDSKYFLYKKYK